MNLQLQPSIVNSLKNLSKVSVIVIWQLSRKEMYRVKSILLYLDFCSEQKVERFSLKYLIYYVCSLQFFSFCLMRRLRLAKSKYCYFSQFMSSLAVQFLGFTCYFILAALIAVILAKSQYKVSNQIKTTSRIELTLDYTGTDEYYLKPTSPIVNKLKLVFQVLTYNDFFFKITDAVKSRFQIPQYPPFPVDPLQNFSFPIAAADVIFQYNSDPFDFTLKRRQDKAILFDSKSIEFIYSDHYIQIGTQVDTNNIYGFGERFHRKLRVQDGKWTLFNRDRGQTIDQGKGQQSYGYYPFYLMRERNNLFHVNYFRSSNAMDVIKETQNAQHYLTYKVIGGIIDFRFFLAENNPEVALQKFHFYCGAATIPPFWAFGYHQSRWGYKNITYLQNMISNFQKHGLPLDTVWNDLDYMVNFQDFTWDQQKFPLEEMKQLLKNYKYIPIMDATIKASGEIYEEGLKRNIYIREANPQKIYVGKMRTGPSTFVDFLHPNASRYWQDMLGRLYEKVHFSGIWLDMNQYTNYCDGACSPTTDPPQFDYSQDLPYTPGEDSIESDTISLNTTHYGGIQESNVHVYAGYLGAVATNQFLQTKTSKPFIITRSTTIGTSKYGSHWTGDNYASWQFLKGSIADNLHCGLWGMNMVGADICGFSGNATVEICARWYQIGSLYMFARNHNSVHYIDQQPYALGDRVLQSAKANLKLRYSLLKHFYGIFVNKKGLGTVWKPVFFDYVFDNATYTDSVADTQFLIGNILMAAPIVEGGVNSRSVYFPEVGWFDYHSGHFYKNKTDNITNEVTDLVPLFLRQGSALFSQNVDSVTKTGHLNNKFTLKIGAHYQHSLSTPTHKVYVAIGNTLSIADYNDDQKVELCKVEGCQYIVNIIFNVRESSKSLEIDFVYDGGKGLNQKIVVDGVNIMCEGGYLVDQAIGPYEIMGSQRVVVPIGQEDQESEQ